VAWPQAIIQGWAPGKFGVSQHITMSAGTYDLSAMVAAQGVELGLFDQTFSFLIIVDDAPSVPGRIIGDIRVLPKPDAEEGWREFSGSFSLKAAANITVYFRAWGAGFFFVDNVWMALRACSGAPGPDAFALGPIVKPLDFVRPIEYEDLLLCGYCSGDGNGDDGNSIDTGGAPTQTCARCKAANRTALLPPQQASTPHVLVNYTDHTSFFDPSPCWNASLPPASKVPSLLLGQGCFIESDDAVLLHDWSQYARLVFTVSNPTPDPQSLYVEIDDCQSTDYWSRYVVLCVCVLRGCVASLPLFSFPLLVF
jgi:hypothetical protein